MKSVDGFFIWICMYRAQYWEISEVEKSKELDHFVLDSRTRQEDRNCVTFFPTLLAWIWIIKRSLK